MLRSACIRKRHLLLTYALLIHTSRSHAAFKGACSICRSPVFDWEERWRTAEGPYVHKACAQSEGEESLSRGIAAVGAPATPAAVLALGANEEECSCLVLKLRGSRFPVKDSGIEGSLADPFFEIRANYVVGESHVGEHDTEPAYKSKKVRQDLNPHFRTIAIDLRKLCGLDRKRKLLLDFFDWDRSETLKAHPRSKKN